MSSKPALPIGAEPYSFGEGVIVSEEKLAEFLDQNWKESAEWLITTDIENEPLQKKFRLYFEQAIAAAMMKGVQLGTAQHSTGKGSELKLHIGAHVVGRHAPDSRELLERQEELLERERLKTLLLEKDRTLLAIQRAHDELKAQNAKFLDAVCEMTLANKSLGLALLAHHNLQVCLHEHHVGEVTKVLGDQVEVTYETVTNMCIIV